ncbi:hypothetical protein QO034_07545 [Sedimentitalea sp. JM2-8]|uniref:Uncharacterized protein n=1 Tax=Sedimentitalea xiamensis TaxID=3050037 RepID=A0ABT7FDQ4_9RHOB|nr:hypothetical protein [Sedimentitalea xiamensis]MDK3072959.1 hypothetical protein [Sedimentitalea xiamensis]
MQQILIVAAALTALAIPAHATPYETPYALSAVHAEFQTRLEHAAETPGAIGAAARVAADLMTRQNAAQERVVLPLLGWADVTPARGMKASADLPDRMRIETEVSQLYDGDVNLVTALVELYAAADEAGDSETARLAETMIWHQTSDAEVLYPAALLVEAAMQAQVPSADPHKPGTGN